MDLFRAALTDRVGGAKLSKLCHTYPAMMKLDTVIPDLKNIQKYKNHIIPLTSADISIHSPEISNFCYIEKCR